MRVGTIANCRELIAEIAQKYGFTVIDGKSLVPNDFPYFVDGLHPNDDGYEHYAKNLIEKLDKE